MIKSKGIVKWFNSSRGYGFAINNSGEDVFIHYRSIISNLVFKMLVEGQQIAFIQVRSEKGWQAAKVEVLETAKN